MPTHALSPERLAVFTPFSTLDDALRILLCYQIQVQEAADGAPLPSPGETRALFLLSGRVQLTGSAERSLSAGDDNSRCDLGLLEPAPQQIISRGPSRYFLFDRQLLQDLQQGNNTPVPPLARMLAENAGHPVIRRFYQALSTARVRLPALPEVTHKISRIIVDDELNARHIASLVAADASVSARLMKLANSSLYRGLNTITELPEAVTRLGMETTRHLVLAFALQEMQHQPRSDMIRKRLLRSWKESIQLAALCYVLAKKCTRIPPEEALLAGLLHNIGELPLLSFAAEDPDLARDPAPLEPVIEESRAQAGALLLHHWNLPAPLITAVQHSDTWFYQANEQEPSLTDVLILARLHSLAMREDSGPLPDIRQVPSFEKVSPGALNDCQHLEILVDAKEQILEIRELFNR